MEMGQRETKFTGRYYIQISEIDRIEVMELISLKRKLYKRTGIEEETKKNTRDHKSPFLLFLIIEKWWNQQTVFQKGREGESEGGLAKMCVTFALFADALLPSLDKKERGDCPEPLESRRILSP